MRCRRSIKKGRLGNSSFELFVIHRPVVLLPKLLLPIVVMMCCVASSVAVSVEGLTIRNSGDANDRNDNNIIQEKDRAPHDTNRIVSPIVFNSNTDYKTKYNGGIKSPPTHKKRQLHHKLVSKQMQQRRKVSATDWRNVKNLDTILDGPYEGKEHRYHHLHEYTAQSRTDDQARRKRKWKLKKSLSPTKTRRKAYKSTSKRKSTSAFSTIKPLDAVKANATVQKTAKSSKSKTTIETDHPEAAIKQTDISVAESTVTRTSPVTSKSTVNKLLVGNKSLTTKKEQINKYKQNLDVKSDKKIETDVTQPSPSTLSKKTSTVRPVAHKSKISTTSKKTPTENPSVTKDHNTLKSKTTRVTRLTTTVTPSSSNFMTDVEPTTSLKSEDASHRSSITTKPLTTSSGRDYRNDSAQLTVNQNGKATGGADGATIQPSLARNATNAIEIRDTLRPESSTAKSDMPMVTEEGLLQSATALVKGDEYNLREVPHEEREPRTYHNDEDVSASDDDDDDGRLDTNRYAAEAADREGVSDDAVVDNDDVESSSTRSVLPSDMFRIVGDISTIVPNDEGGAFLFTEPRTETHAEFANVPEDVHREDTEPNRAVPRVVQHVYKTPKPNPAGVVEENADEERDVTGAKLIKHQNLKIINVKPSLQLQKADESRLRDISIAYPRLGKIHSVRILNLNKNPLFTIKSTTSRSAAKQHIKPNVSKCFGRTGANTISAREKQIPEDLKEDIDEPGELIIQEIRPRIHSKNLGYLAIGDSASDAPDNDISTKNDATTSGQTANDATSAPSSSTVGTPDAGTNDTSTTKSSGTADTALSGNNTTDTKAKEETPPPQQDVAGSPEVTNEGLAGKLLNTSCLVFISTDQAMLDQLREQYTNMPNVVIGNINKMTLNASRSPTANQVNKYHSKMYSITPMQSEREEEEDIKEQGSNQAAFLTSDPDKENVNENIEDENDVESPIGLQDEDNANDKQKESEPLLPEQGMKKVLLKPISVKGNEVEATVREDYEEEDANAELASMGTPESTGETLKGTTTKLTTRATPTSSGGELDTMRYDHKYEEIENTLSDVGESSRKNNKDKPHPSVKSYMKYKIKELNEKHKLKEEEKKEEGKKIQAGKKGEEKVGETTKGGDKKVEAKNNLVKVQELTKTENDETKQKVKKTKNKTAPKSSTKKHKGGGEVQAADLKKPTSNETVTNSTGSVNTTTPTVNTTTTSTTTTATPTTTSPTTMKATTTTGTAGGAKGPLTAFVSKSSAEPTKIESTMTVENTSPSPDCSSTISGDGSTVLSTTKSVSTALVSTSSYGTSSTKVMPFTPLVTGIPTTICPIASPQSTMIIPTTICLATPGMGRSSPGTIVNSPDDINGLYTEESNRLDAFAIEGGGYDEELVTEPISTIPAKGKQGSQEICTDPGECNYYYNQGMATIKLPPLNVSDTQKIMGGKILNVTCMIYISPPNTTPNESGGGRQQTQTSGLSYPTSATDMEDCGDNSTDSSQPSPTKGEPAVINHTENGILEMLREPTLPDIEGVDDNGVQYITELYAGKGEPEMSTDSTCFETTFLSDDTKDDTEPEQGSSITVAEECPDLNKLYEGMPTKITENRNAPPLVEFKLDLKTHNVNHGNDNGFSLSYPPRNGNVRGLETNSPIAAGGDSKHIQNMDVDASNRVMVQTTEPPCIVNIPPKVHGAYPTDRCVTSSIQRDLVNEAMINETNFNPNSVMTNFLRCATGGSHINSHGKGKVYNATCQIIVDSPNSIKIVGPSELSSPYLSELHISTIRPDPSCKPYPVEEPTPKVDICNNDEMIMPGSEVPSNENVVAITGKPVCDQYTETSTVPMEELLQQAFSDSSGVGTSKVNLDDIDQGCQRTNLNDLTPNSEPTSCSDQNDMLGDRLSDPMCQTESTPSHDALHDVNAHCNDMDMLVNATASPCVPTVAPTELDSRHPFAEQINETTCDDDAALKGIESRNRTNNNLGLDTVCPVSNSPLNEKGTVVPSDQLNQLVKTIAESITECIEEFLGKGMGKLENDVCFGSAPMTAPSKLGTPYPAVEKSDEQGTSKVSWDESENNSCEEHIEGNASFSGSNATLGTISDKSTCNTDLSCPTHSVKVVSPASDYCNGQSEHYSKNPFVGSTTKQTFQSPPTTGDAVYYMISEENSDPGYHTIHDTKQSEILPNQMKTIASDVKFSQKPSYSGQLSKYVMKVRPIRPKQGSTTNASNTDNSNSNTFGQTDKYMKAKVPSNSSYLSTTKSSNPKNVEKHKYFPMTKMHTSSTTNEPYAVNENENYKSALINGAKNKIPHFKFKYPMSKFLDPITQELSTAADDLENSAFLATSFQSNPESIRNYRPTETTASFKNDTGLDYHRFNETGKAKFYSNRQLDTNLGSINHTMSIKPPDLTGIETHSLLSNKMINHTAAMNKKKNSRLNSGASNNLGFSSGTEDTSPNRYGNYMKPVEFVDDPQPPKVIYVPHPKKPSGPGGVILNNDDITKMNMTNKKIPSFGDPYSLYNSLPKNSERVKISSFSKITQPISSHVGPTYYKLSPQRPMEYKTTLPQSESEPALRSVTTSITSASGKGYRVVPVENSLYHMKVPKEFMANREVCILGSRPSTAVSKNKVLIEVAPHDTRVKEATKRVDVKLLPNVGNFFRLRYPQNLANFVNGRVYAGDSRVKKVPSLNTTDTDVDNGVSFHLVSTEPTYLEHRVRKGKGRKKNVNKMPTSLVKKPHGKLKKMNYSSERPVIFNFKLKQPIVDDEEIAEADSESDDQADFTSVPGVNNNVGTNTEYLTETSETNETGQELSRESTSECKTESAMTTSTQCTVLPTKIQIPLKICIEPSPLPLLQLPQASAAMQAKNLSEIKPINDSLDQSKLWDNKLSPFELRQIQAKNMIKYMDTSVNPCQDFYQYACGNWHKYHPIPPDHGGFDTFEMLRENLDLHLKTLLEDDSDNAVYEDKCKEDDKISLELYNFAPNQTVPSPYFEEVLNSVRTEFVDPIRKAKNLYNSCMKERLIDRRGDKPLLHLITELRGWPILELDWEASNFDLIWLLGQLRLYNNDLLISEWIGPDIKNSDEYVIQLDQTSLGLPSREYFLSETSREYIEAYHQFMLDIVYILGAPEDQAVDDVKDIIDFEIKLAMITADPEDRRNLTSIYARLSLGELQVFLPQIDWIRYFRIIAERDILVTTPIVCYCMSYLQDLVNLVSTSRARTLANYLLWRFVRHRVNNLDERFQNAKQKFYHLLFGREASPPRWQFCVAQVNSNLGMALGNLFVNAHFDERSKNDTIFMTRQLESAFKNILMLSDWLDDSTRSIAIAKVDAMRLRIGYPDIILNKQLLMERYKDIKVHPDYYFENSLSILRHLTRNEHQKIGKMVDKNMWNTAPAVVNAYYSRNKNQIMFPAGILQPPFYHQHFPKALNYGGIGVVIGHEITHGFDDKGRLFDKDGNLNTWWSDEATEKFRDKAKCIVDQYNSFVVPEVNAPLDGMTTQGENIADNGGIKQAFKAYQDWLTKHTDLPLPSFNASNNQLFFLNFAQVWCGSSRPEAAKNRLKTAVHSPGRFRVIGTLRNSYDFAVAYQCPTGSPMNPVGKCMVW